MTNATLTPGPLNDAPTAPSTSVNQAAVIVNPVKFSARHLARFTAKVSRAFQAQGWLSPLWLHTTAETRGSDEARLAVAAGVDLVFVAGGDGTIRTVAQELAGTGVSMAILARGTGNLLARNLGIPRKDIVEAVKVACTGVDRAVDVGWAELDVDGDGQHTERFAFLVMAGAGFDAAMMAGANHTMKTRLGPSAYLVSGTRAIQRPMSATTVSVDGVLMDHRRSRGIVVGNCGSLMMGLSLMPDADPFDGVLDGVVLYQRTPLDWARVAWSVLTHDRRDSRHMPHVRGGSIVVHTDSAQLVEVDGDVVGEARAVRFAVQPGALLVRCPAARD
ncbi:diacylglycerol/lipid kinase family protein [Herbiconiux sp. P18]|uniref:diacylglycerol/lipid kinase family protein n=1 Tax=Herbiconiux liangxiaofengii TaxID=3342795 RepID=UPI0035B755B4